jgi:hypothetical protein
MFPVLLFCRPDAGPDGGAITPTPKRAPLPPIAFFARIYNRSCTTY